jgi:hypothetical protein
MNLICHSETRAQPAGPESITIKAVGIVQMPRDRARCGYGFRLSRLRRSAGMTGRGEAIE